MCFASKNVNRAVPICTTYVQLSTVLLMKYKIKNLDQQLRPFSKILLLSFMRDKQGKKLLTRIVASVGDHFSVFISERSGRRNFVVRVLQIRDRRIGFAVSRIVTTRNESGKFESLRRPHPIRQTVQSLSWIFKFNCLNLFWFLFWL